MTDAEKDIVYQLYHEKVLRYLEYHVQSKEVCLDLSQDIFMKVFNNIDNYDQTIAKLSTWIYTIAKNVLIDYYRKQKNEAVFDESIIEDVLDEPNDPVSDDFINAIKKLDKREQKIILMHYYDGVSLKEIAKELNISYIFTKVLHKKALESLKTILK